MLLVLTYFSKEQLIDMYCNNVLKINGESKEGSYQNNVSRRKIKLCVTSWAKLFAYAPQKGRQPN